MKKILTMIMAVATLSLFLCGCSIGSHVNYKNADQYMVGNTEISDKVEEIAISWLDGSVKIEYHDKNTVTISETSARTLTDEISVHWWLDGSTLRIQYAASNQTIPANLNKKLTVTLPKELHLKGLTVSTTSGDIEIGTLSADQVTTSSTSGDVKLQCSAENISLSATSGDLDVTQIGETDKIAMSTTSGEIHIQSDKVKQVVTGSTSGDVTAVCEQTPEQLDISTTSGDVTVKLPKDASLTAKVNTTSGSFNSDLEMTKVDNSYVYGSGSGSFSISTTSGDVSILEKK